MKKVLQACSVEFTYDKFLSPLANELSRNGYEVHAAFTFDEESSLGRVKDKNINFHNIKIYRSKSLLKLIISFFNVILFLNKNHFDIVHVHTPIAAILYRIGSLFSKNKNVYYTVHGFYFHENQSIFLRYINFLIELSLSFIQTKTFFVSSEDLIVSSIFMFGSNKNKYLVKNGCDHQIFYPTVKENIILARKKVKFLDSDFVIGFVGRMVEEKGLNILMESFELLANECPNMKLLLCGGVLKSDYSTPLINKIHKLMKKYQDRIFLTGFIDNINYFYPAMDVFCLPSFREGMPTSLIEAMMTDLVTISTDIRGSREIINNKYNGFLIPPRDLNALTEILRDIYYIFERENTLSSVLKTSPRKSALELELDLESVIQKYIKNY